MEPVACTLSSDDRLLRAARWAALPLAAVDETPTGLRLRFTAGGDELEELAALERRCCAFADWRVDGTTLEVDGHSPEGVAAVRALFASLR